MRQRLLNKKLFCLIGLLLCLCWHNVYAEYVNLGENVSIDRIQLVSEQIDLLKNRINQAQIELNNLQQDEQIPPNTLDKASKNLLDKASLDISVAKSNVESITIEVGDSQQTISWLEKNIQEIENQLNVLNIFGLKVAPKEMIHIREYKQDLLYQQKLLGLEKNRYVYLQQLQKLANHVLKLQKQKYERLNDIVKTRNLLHLKQQQVKDELAYQQQQNNWLEQLNVLYARLAKIDPAQSKSAYASVERDIFYTNENANFAYVQSLIARYKDQIQQMKLAILKSNSITLLNEIGNQVQTLSKQIKRLETVVQSRTNVLENHIQFLQDKKTADSTYAPYLKKLTMLHSQYQRTASNLENLNTQLTDFRKTLDAALQSELSSRQGMPSFGLKTWLDLGKEMLLVPALTFQVIKSLSNHFVRAFQNASVFSWLLFLLAQSALVFVFYLLRKTIQYILRPSEWQDSVNSKWFLFECVRRNFIDIACIVNLLGIMYFFAVPTQNLIFIAYLACVWLIFKVIITTSRIFLVETTHDTTGHDVKLYKRIRWVILAGGIITGLTVFVHQLPLIYELRSLFDRLFLLVLMIVSILLLRSRDVISNLILSQMQAQHPYLQKSIRLIGILIPFLLLANSIVGLLGFVNLIMTVSWYEGIFLIVLMGYLVLRGLLSDGMEQLSRMMIQYVNNGWLWTEAFLKPIDKVLRVTLFLSAWAILFLLYGWDNQSPIVARLSGLLQYPLMSISKTHITPINIIELFVVISIFYWTAKWTREFVYRLLLSRTKDMGIRNSIAILSQYAVVILGVFICLRVLGIDLNALTAVAAALAFGIGLGLRDLGNNFASGFLLLFERPLRVGDIVKIDEFEGDVVHIGSRAVTIRTWDHTELVVPNTEFFTKSFTNWTAHDNIVRTVAALKVSRFDNPHEVKIIIQNVINANKDILKEPASDVLLKEMNEVFMEFEFRYYVNIRQVKSRVCVLSTVLMSIWDAFAKHGIKPPYPQHEVYLKGDVQSLNVSDLDLKRLTKDS
jgi:potassium efflux system protein